jgi:hypothetical protein
MMFGYIIAGIFGLISWAVSKRLKNKFRKYSETRLQSNLSGAEIAKLMLNDHGIYNVTVHSVDGELTDHYNPDKLTVNLSHDVYHGRNAAAAAVAAHECGHAVQHAKAYAFLTFRSAMVPALSISSNVMPWIIMIGFFALRFSLIPLGIGIVLFTLTTIFSFVTLPVEFDASNRALAWIERRKIVTPQEHAMSKDALWWAAMTYVVSALGSLATLLYYVSVFLGARRSD